MDDSRGTHQAGEDPRNAGVLVYVNGRIVPRHEARVSVFDSGFILGDGVWEGLRLHNGRVAFLDQHMKRLFQGAKALDLEIGLTACELAGEIERTVAANRMTSGVHIRLMVTRGEKSTPYQDPRVNVGGSTIVIIPEFKEAAERQAGVRLFTVHVRRGAPDVQDPMLNSHSKLNCILACLQATKAGADEALMLDPHGFVATCNSTHFFVVRDGEVWTSTGRYCLHGITRANVLKLCGENAIVARQKDFSLVEVYDADEAFITGTFAGLTPVASVDGRTIASTVPGPVTARLRGLYADLIEKECPAA
jgi:branched-chain amino acid aminotransferase